LAEFFLEMSENSQKRVSTWLTAGEEKAADESTFFQ
jgi:hypothetical protein